MQSFTFITNSDGASGKVASQQTRTVIRAHVMRKHWTEKPSPTKFVSARCKLRQQIGDGHTHRTSIGKQAKTMNDATHSSQEAHKETIDQSPPSPVSTASSASSEDTIVSRHLNRTTDAFVYAGSSIDVKSYGYFHHYTLEFHYAIPTSIQPLPLSKASPCSLRAIQENSQVLLQAICFMSAFHQSMKRTKDSKGWLMSSCYDDDTLRYKALTLRKLSDRVMEDPAGGVVTQADILCISMLLFADTIPGDEIAVPAHLLGLTRMIAAHGGQESLSPMVLTHVQFTTLLAAQLWQTRPILELQPASQQRFDRVCAAPFSPKGIFLSECGLGAGFFSQSLASSLSPHLQQCMCYMRQVVARIEEVHSSTQPFEGNWMDDVLALKHVLVSMPHDQCLSQLDESVRLALLLYCNTAMWRIPLYFRWVMALVTCFKSALLALHTTEGWAFPELRLWMQFIGRQACTIEFSEDETAWWNSEIRQTAGILNVDSWDEALRIFQEFFYANRISATRWKAVWTDVIEGTHDADAYEIVRDPAHPCDFC